MLLGHCACFGCLLLVVSLALLRLALLTEVIAAGDAPDRLFDLALDLVAGTHVSLPFLPQPTEIEYPGSEGSNQFAAQETFGGVDVVVHAAGIMALGTVADMDLDVFDRQVRTNLRGTFVVDQQAARRVRCGGAIINFSSSVLALQAPTYAGYAATKGGVEAMTLILARELRGRDITVNAVAPGPTATALFLKGKDEETIQRLALQARWSAWVPPGTSPRLSRSSPVRPAGSTARSCAPTAASSNPFSRAPSAQTG